MSDAAFSPCPAGGLRFGDAEAQTIPAGLRAASAGVSSAVVGGLRWLAILLLSLSVIASAHARERLEYPEWFAQTFYDLPGDLDDAVARGKRGIALFFSAEACLHCVAMARSTFSDPEVVRRFSGHFDVIAVDVFSDVEMVGLDGQMFRARELSENERATFTPTLLFVDGNGERMLRHVGFANSERMHLILGYLESDAWREESLREFLARGQEREASGADAASVAVDQSSLAGFQNPPADLAALRTAHPRPSLVLFERPGCEECRRMREMVLLHPTVQEVLAGFHALRMNTDAPEVAVMPDGRFGSGNELAVQLELTHRPALLFYSEDGEEAFRMDSSWLIDYSGELAEDSRSEMIDSFLARLEYVASGGYREWPQYQRWRAYRDRDDVVSR